MNMKYLNRRKFIKKTTIFAGIMPLNLNLFEAGNLFQDKLNTKEPDDNFQSGVLYCPRVTSEHNADTTDLSRFRKFHKWKYKENEELAIAIWQYLCDYETGLYHFYEVLDGNDPFKEFATMRDPLKMLNVYNMGYCGIFGATAEGIFYGCGFKTGRSFYLNAWNHSATEIFYNKKWHYFDVDVRGALVKSDGTIASLNEARTDKQLWLNSQEKIKPYFPNHDSSSEQILRVADIYAKDYPDGSSYQFRWFQGSHTADYILRPGESLTRWWNDESGRWNHYPSYNKETWVRNLLMEPPTGMKPNHRHFTRWNHGVGLFHYQPKLTDDSNDFQAGALHADGLTPGVEGLQLTAKTGTAVFNIFTPFPIVPRVNNIENEEDDNEAVIITLNTALPVTLEISADNGITWKRAGKASAGNAVFDATRFVKRNYGFLLKLSATGNKGETAIHSMEVRTWVQIAPISLPRLMKGENKLRFEFGDRYDKATIPMLVTPNCGDPEDLKKYVVKMPDNYDPKRNTARIIGEVILKCQAPATHKIAWLSAGGTFNTLRRKEAPNTQNMMSFAVNKPRNFIKIYESNNPEWVDHWRYNHDTDIVLDKPAETVFVKYIGNPGVSVIRACLHLIPKQPVSSSIKITHGYKVNEKDQEKTVQFTNSSEYAITCKDDVENTFIKIEAINS